MINKYVCNVEKCLLGFRVTCLILDDKDELIKQFSYTADSMLGIGCVIHLFIDLHMDEEAMSEQLNYFVT